MKKIFIAIISLTAVIAVGLIFNNLFAGLGGGSVIAMALTGYVRTCGLQSGGGKKLYLIEAPDLTSFTKNVSGEDYTTCTPATGKVFKQYEFDPDSFEIKEDVAIENNCMKVTHTLEFYIAKMSDTGRTAVNEIALASACGLVAVAEDNNGTKWVIGYSQNMAKLRPLELASSAGATGKKLTDANGYTLKLVSEDNEEMRTFTGTVPLT